MKITKKTTLGNILEIKGAEEVLFKNGVPCLHCPMAHLEMNIIKIGDICRAYDIDIEKVLKDLNKLKE